MFNFFFDFRINFACTHDRLKGSEERKRYGYCPIRYVIRAKNRIEEEEEWPCTC